MCILLNTKDAFKAELNIEFLYKLPKVFIDLKSSHWICFAKTSVSYWWVLSLQRCTNESKIVWISLKIKQMGKIWIYGCIALWKWTQTLEKIVCNCLKQARNATCLFTPLATRISVIAPDIPFLHPIVMLFMEKVLGLRLLSGYVNIYSTISPVDLC